MNQIVIFLAVLVAVSASSVYRPPTRYGASHHGGRIVHGGSGGGGFIGGGSFGGSGYGGSGIGTQIIRGPLVHQRLNEYASLSDFSHIGGGGHGVGGGIVHGGFGGRGHGIGGSIGRVSPVRIHHGGGGYGRPRVTYH